jgi:protein-tyrosine kinase
MQMSAAAPAASTPSRTGDRTRMIGAILLEAGRLNEAQIHEIKRFAELQGLRFGDAAVQLKLLTPEDIDFALRKQFKYPLLNRGEGGVADDLVAAYNPHCELVENLRTIRSRLLSNWHKGADRHVLAVVSPGRGEGRSWFAANLAVVFAQAGERTLLIDADMRHPKQHQLFKIDGNLGLSALLSGRAGAEVAARIHPELRLFAVPAGATPPNPQELITRNVFEVVLDRFAQQFDLVLLDTPAAAESADAELLAASAGAAVVVARRDHTSSEQLLNTKRRLDVSGVKVLGSVLNDY